MLHELNPAARKSRAALHCCLSSEPCPICTSQSLHKQSTGPEPWRRAVFYPLCMCAYRQGSTLRAKLPLRSLRTNKSGAARLVAFFYLKYYPSAPVFLSPPSQPAPTSFPSGVAPVTKCVPYLGGTMAYEETISGTLFKNVLALSCPRPRPDAVPGPVGPGRTWGSAGQNHLTLLVSILRPHLLTYVWDLVINEFSDSRPHNFCQVGSLTLLTIKDPLRRCRPLALKGTHPPSVSYP